MYFETVLSYLATL